MARKGEDLTASWISRTPTGLILGMRPIQFSIAVTVALVALWAVLGIAGAALGLGIAPLSTLVFVLAAAEPVACFSAAVICRSHERQAWSLLGAAGTAMLMGYVIGWAQTGVITSPVSGPDIAVLLWSVASVLHILAVLRFFDAGHARWISAVHRVLDMLLLLIFGFLAAFSFAVVFFFPDNPGALFSTPMLPAMMSIVLSVGAAIFTFSLRPQLREWHIVMVAGIISLLLSSFLRAIVMSQGDLVGLSRMAIDIPWYLGGSLFVVAAIVRIAVSDRVSKNELIEIEEPTVGWGILTTGGVIIALPAFVFVSLEYTLTGIERIVLTSLVALLGIVAVARNLGAAVENAELRRRSATDPLTGLFNHRFFHERLTEETQRAEREGTQLSVAVFDIDDFNMVNDVHGHAVGDQCLREIANRLVGASRSYDVLCRVGGDEFALIMPDTDPIDAFKVCLRAQACVREEDMAASSVDHSATLSMGLSAGIAGYPAHALQHTDLVHKADGALYWAKFNGKEQVVIYDPDLVRVLGPEQRIELLEEEAYLNMVQMLAAAVDARDAYTQRHSHSVAELAVEFGTRLGLTQQHIRDLKTAALLHDVGKIGVPDAVLRKPGKLTSEERALIEEHPELAARILSATPRQEILPWIVAHHERWDGAGYPAGLVGEDIPYEARIIAICDSYEAMTSDRLYRGGLTLAQGVDEVLSHAGTQFDPELAHVFTELIEDQMLFAPEGSDIV